MPDSAVVEKEFWARPGEIPATSKKTVNCEHRKEIMKLLREKQSRKKELRSDNYVVWGIDDLFYSVMLATHLLCCDWTAVDGVILQISHEGAFRGFITCSRVDARLARNLEVPGLPPRPSSPCFEP